MYSARVRLDATSLRRRGHTWGDISRRLGVNRSTLRAWQADDGNVPARECPSCDGHVRDEPAYAALLGYYLGDGCVSRARRYHSLRISCDQRWPGIIDDVADTMRRVHAGRVYLVQAPGCVVVQSHWVHWCCAFPQYGPGRKHERPIVLEGWQIAIVSVWPAAFLRGLFHSDGCRFVNSTVQMVAGERKRYDYPRWQFTNVSADIRELCCWALDLVDVAWRQSNWNCISVSRREAVARLDDLIGLKA